MRDCIFFLINFFRNYIRSEIGKEYHAGKEEHARGPNGKAPPKYR